VRGLSCLQLARLVSMPRPASTPAPPLILRAGVLESRRSIRRNSPRCADAQIRCGTAPTTRAETRPRAGAARTSDARPPVSRSSSSKCCGPALAQLTRV